MTEQEKLDRMRSIPGFVELSEDWTDRVKIGSALLKSEGTLDGEIRREEFVVSNVGKKLTLSALKRLRFLRSPELELQRRCQVASTDSG